MLVVALSHEPIAGSVYGQKVLWLFWIGFQLLAKTYQVRIHGTRGGVILVTPNILQQAIAAQRFAAKEC
jgi:hypothetical protein